MKSTIALYVILSMIAYAVTSPLKDYPSTDKAPTALMIDNTVETQTPFCFSPKPNMIRCYDPSVAPCVTDTECEEMFRNIPNTPREPFIIDDGKLLAADIRI